MKTAKTIVKNTVVLISGEVVGKFLALVFTIYMARYLQVEGFGILSFGLAFAGMFGLFADIGFFELTIREVSRDKSSALKYFSNIATLKLLIMVPVFGSMFAFINLMGYPLQTVQVVYLLGASMILDSISMIFNSTFQAFEEMEYVSIGKIIKNVLLLGGTFAAIFMGLGILAFPGLYLLASLITLLFNVVISIRKFVVPKLSFDKDFCIWLLKEGVPFWTSSAFVAILNQTDKIMLSFLVDDSAVGIYSAAFRIVYTMNFIPIMFVSAIYPATSRLFLTSRDSLKELFERSFKYLLIAGILFVIVVNSYSDFIIVRIFGEGYNASVLCLEILVWASLFIFLDVGYSNLLRSTDRQVQVMYVTMLIASLNVVLNLVLIPMYSYIGASYATLLSRMVAFLIFSSIIMKSDFRFSTKTLIDGGKVIALTLGIWGMLNFIDSNSIIPGIGEYFVVIYLLVAPVMFIYFNVIDPIDRKLILDMLSSLRANLSGRIDNT